MRLTTGASSPTYILSYDLPTVGDGNAGLVFNFDDGHNVSQYQKIEFTIQFQARGEKVDLYLKDISGSDDVPPYRITSTGTDKMNVSIFLKDFSGLNINALKEIAFDVNTTFERCFQEISISNIKFIP